MRNFKDLLEQVKLNGEYIIPIREIVKLAFNCDEESVYRNFDMWISEYGYAYYEFYFYGLNPDTLRYLLRIDDIFNIDAELHINGVASNGVIRNQVKIFNLLKQLNFI